MNCKNCSNIILEDIGYCSRCGAKVVRNRLTMGVMFQEFLDTVFGWDNTYFRTFRTMFISPDKVIRAYVDGVRKKYMPPFTFLLIGLTMATLLFNAFSEKYVEFSVNIFGDGFYESQFNNLKINESEAYFESKEYKADLKEYAKEQKQFHKKWNRNVLKYFNLVSFVSIPLYTLLSMLVFGRKKHNYAEHLVINSYIQGLSMTTMTLLFVIATFTSHWIFSGSVLIAIFYYSFTYRKLYEFSRWKSFLKFLKFIGIIIIPFLLLFILGIVVGYLMKTLGVVG